MYGMVVRESRGVGQESSGAFSEMEDEECSIVALSSKYDPRRSKLESKSGDHFGRVQRVGDKFGGNVG